MIHKQNPALALMRTKPNGTIHFVEVSTVPATFNLFEPLVFDETEETKDKSFIERLNPNSWIICKVCRSLTKGHQTIRSFQFIRNGYFCTDKESSINNLVFNRTCPLKSSFN